MPTFQEKVPNLQRLTADKMSTPATNSSYGNSRNKVRPERIEAEKYQKIYNCLSENLKTTLKINHNFIPHHFGKVKGTLELEAHEEICHNGVFIVMKGLSMSDKRRRKLRVEGRKCTHELKFQILGHNSMVGAQVLVPGMQIYPLKLAARVRKGKVSEDLPVPIITPEGLLAFTFQAFLSVEGKHFMISEINVPYKTHYSLIENSEIKKAIRSEIRLNYKKGYFSRRRKAYVSLTSSSNGYLPGEVIVFLVEIKNSGKLPLKLGIDLLKKLWYQEPSPYQAATQSPKLLVKLKEISVAAEEKVGESCEKEIIWKGTLKLPPNLTPTYGYDFYNSISYILRLTVEVVGDKAKKKFIGENPIYIGSVKGSEEEEGVVGLENGNADSNCGGINSLFVMGLPMTSRTINCIYNEAEIFEAMNPSGEPVESLENSTMSLSLCFSQHFSRRLTLETLNLSMNLFAFL